MGRNPSGDLGGAHETSLANDTKTPRVKEEAVLGPSPKSGHPCPGAETLGPCHRTWGMPVCSEPACPQSPPQEVAVTPSPDRTVLALRMWRGPRAWEQIGDGTPRVTPGHPL